MQVSIITVAFNAEKTIEDTILSVLRQDYESIEYIIIDGASQDGTMSVVEQYKDRIDTVVSEKDKGIYDGMNKGIEKATGDLIGILNADDFYVHEQVISNILSAQQSVDADAVYANLQYVNAQNTDKVTRKWISGAYRRKKFINGWMPPHPTFFLLKNHYKEFGTYSMTLRSAADYELMLRMLYKHNLKAAYLNDTIISMRVGGQSNASVNNRLKANWEDRKAWLMNNLKPRFYTLFFKPLRKVGQFIFR